MRHSFDRATNARWENCGPDNFSGRATCLAIDPKVPTLMYAGSAAGGLWKSEDGGENWWSCWPHALSQNIIAKDGVHAEIGEVLLGKKPGRESDEEITIFDSTGMAIQDNTTSTKIYWNAIERKVGTFFEFIE